jgi:hypothetical protein
MSAWPPSVPATSMRSASLLIVLGELDDRLRQRRREQQAAAGCRRGLQDEFEIVAKAEIEHLVGLVEHHGLQRGDVEPVALDMVAQTAGRADDDMSALIEQRCLRRGSMPPTQAMTRAPACL